MKSNAMKSLVLVGLMGMSTVMYGSNDRRNDVNNNRGNNGSNMEMRMDNSGRLSMSSNSRGSRNNCYTNNGSRGCNGGYSRGCGRIENGCRMGRRDCGRVVGCGGYVECRPCGPVVVEPVPVVAPVPAPVVPAPCPVVAAPVDPVVATGSAVGTLVGCLISSLMR